MFSSWGVPFTNAHCFILPPPCLWLPCRYLAVRLCCRCLRLSLSPYSAFTSISSSSWDCLALRVTSPPLSNLGDYFWVSHSVWAKELQQHCGINNKPPTTTLWGFAACPGAGEASLRDLCQQLCAQGSDQTLCQVHLSYRACVPTQNALYRTCMCGYDWRSTSSIKIISFPLLSHSRAGNESTELLDTVLVVQGSPAHRVWESPGKHSTYPQPCCRISKWSGINCSPASNSLIDVISN